MKNEVLLKLDNQLCFVLYAASRAFTKLYRPLLNALGLTYPQYLVMLVLWEREGLTVKEIGELLHLDTGTLTPLLKRLELAELVTRRRSRADERKVSIRLTEKGQNLKERAVKVPEWLLCNVGLTFEEFVSVKASLEKMLAEFERLKDSAEIKES